MTFRFVQQAQLIQVTAGVCRLTQPFAILVTHLMTHYMTTRETEEQQKQGHEQQQERASLTQGIQDLTPTARIRPTCHRCERCFGPGSFCEYSRAGYTQIFCWVL